MLFVHNLHFWYALVINIETVWSKFKANDQMNYYYELWIMCSPLGCIAARRRDVDAQGRGRLLTDSIPSPHLRLPLVRTSVEPGGAEAGCVPATPRRAENPPSNPAQRPTRRKSPPWKHAVRPTASSKGVQRRPAFWAKSRLKMHRTVVKDSAYIVDSI